MTSPRAATPEPPRVPAPVRLLAILLVTWVPASLALEASAGLTRLLQYGLPALALLAFRAVVVALGLAAGRGLWTVQPSALRLARAWLVLDVIATALTLATPYFPSNRLPGARWRDLAITATIDGAWLAYLCTSARVKACWSRS